jgi:Na+-transporting methylmalonyl-CoA/oxaloacetate decarboxylase gamma subunit
MGVSPKNGGIIMEMDNFTFGVTLLICGMGGTLVTLAIMSLVMAGLGKLFPEKPEKEN